ncbi:predicted protein, partial [Nematostella vectensis]
MFFQAPLPRCKIQQMRARGLTGVAPPSAYIPQCLDDGSYESVQCLQATQYCWCVGSNGFEIPGSREFGRPDCDDMTINLTTCHTDRMRALAWTGRLIINTFVPRCLPDGSFEAIQCQPATGKCWCVDVNGNELVGTRTDSKPVCTSRAGLSECQRERQRVLGWSGVAVDGTFVPECTADGGYERVQCHEVTGFCWCVDGNGNEIPKSRLQGRPVC